MREPTARQVAAGTDALNVNVCIPGLDEVSLLPEAVKVVAVEVNVSHRIDSSTPKTMAAALAAAPGKPLVNSVTGQQALLQSMLPIVNDRGSVVIGPTTDDKGIPNNPYGRLAGVSRILEQAARIGPVYDVMIDPLVMAVSTDQKASEVTLKTIGLVRRECRGTLRNHRSGEIHSDHPCNRSALWS